MTGGQFISGGQNILWHQLRPCSYNTIFSPCKLHSSHCIRHHLGLSHCIRHHFGLPLPETNLYICTKKVKFSHTRLSTQKGWRLSWLTCSGWFTHNSGHPSAAGRAQDRESSPVRDRRSTTVPRHQPTSVLTDRQTDAHKTTAYTALV